MTWTNDDGLIVKFGLDEAKLSNIGAYRTNGPKRLIEVILDYRNLPAVASNSVLLDDAFAIDNGAYIESVEIVGSTDFDSTSDDMTLNLGLVDTDGTSNADADALIVAATQSELNAQATNDSGWKGVAIGTTLTSAKKLTWEVDNHAPTVGLAVVRIVWSVPPANADTLVWSKS